MVIISTRAVALIIQAVSAPSIFPPCASAGEAISAVAMVVEARRANARIMSSPGGAFHFLKCVDVGLAGADAHGLFDWQHENLAVTDLSGARGRRERFHDAVQLVAGDRNLEPQLGKEIHRVFGAAIDFGMALLPPVAFDLAHGHAVNADACEGFAHLVEFERLDDSDDHFHELPRKNRPQSVSAVTNEKPPGLCRCRSRLHKLTRG